MLFGNVPPSPLPASARQKHSSVPCWLPGPGAFARGVVAAVGAVTREFVRAGGALGGGIVAAPGASARGIVVAAGDFGGAIVAAAGASARIIVAAANDFGGAFNCMTFPVLNDSVSGPQKDGWVSCLSTTPPSPSPPPPAGPPSPPPPAAPPSVPPPPTPQACFKVTTGSDAKNDGYLTLAVKAYVRPPPTPAAQQPPRRRPLTTRQCQAATPTQA